MCTCHITVLILLTGLKAVITCMKQFNERYGCQLSLPEGDPLANVPMVRCWPPEPNVVLRKNEMIIADAKEVLKLGENVTFQYVPHLWAVPKFS